LVELRQELSLVLLASGDEQDVCVLGREQRLNRVLSPSRFDPCAARLAVRRCRRWQRLGDADARRAAGAAGWDIRYGARLAGDMRAVGLADVASREYTHELPGDSAWARLVTRTLERLREPMLAVGAAHDDINAAISILTDPRTLYRSPTACYAVGRVT
jgi:hypothetical protein